MPKSWIAYSNSCTYIKFINFLFLSSVASSLFCFVFALRFEMFHRMKRTIFFIVNKMKKMNCKVNNIIHVSFILRLNYYRRFYKFNISRLVWKYALCHLLLCLFFWKSNDVLKWNINWMKILFSNIFSVKWRCILFLPPQHFFSFLCFSIRFFFSSIYSNADFYSQHLTARPKSAQILK